MKCKRMEVYFVSIIHFQWVVFIIVKEKGTKKLKLNGNFSENQKFFTNDNRNGTKWN